MSETKTSVVVELKDKFSKAFSTLGTAFSETKNKGNQLGSSIKNIAKEFFTGGEELEKFKAKLNNTETAFEELAKTFGTGFGASQIKNWFKGNLAEAGNREMLSIKLSTVIGNDNQKEFEEYFKKVEQTGIASFQEIVDTGYNLLSAGLSGKQAMIGAKNVIDVAKVTGGQSDLVASTMATASKNFNIDMARVGDIFTKTQLKFQFANFGQLGAGFDMVGASAAALKLPLEQTATAIGMLNDAGITGSQAGTALNAVLRQMNVASKKLGVEITRTSDGSLDLVGFLSQLDDKTKNLNLDQKAAVFQEIFGDEGKRGLLPLIADLDKLAGNLKEVTELSKGITNREVAKFYEAWNTKVAKLAYSMAQLGGSIGKSILPLAGALVNIFAESVFFISDLISKYESLGWIINAVAGTLLVLMGRMFLLRAMAIANWVFGLGNAFLFLRNALNLVKIAFATNPIGFFATALATVAVLIIQNWDSLKSWFVEFFDWFENSTVFKFLKEGFSSFMGLFGGEAPKMDNSSLASVKENSPALNSQNSTHIENKQQFNITSVSHSTNPTDVASETMKQVNKSLVGG